ncbi:MAG: hypothetical protein IPJ84_04905 [Bdellovibrionales bacterium]|nr:hypothetical protein [Bdellovibrionales bacterium]
MARMSPGDLSVNSLSGTELFRVARDHFQKLPDTRDPSRVEIPIEDFFMSALAIFSLKIPSLLQFEEEMRKQRSFSNLKKLFYVSKVPSDTRMREVIDEYQNDVFRPVFRAVFERVQRAKVLKDFELWDNTYGLAVDGTGYFSSDSVHCENCLEKKQRGSDEATFHHQMLAGALVHPDQRCVIPVCPEAIQQQDGNTKNDCEQNAMKRFLLGYREDHPKLKTVLLTDALHATLLA